MNLASKRLFAAGKYGDRQTYHGDITDQIRIVRACTDLALLRRAQADKSLSKTTLGAITTRIRKLSN